MYMYVSTLTSNVVVTNQCLHLNLQYLSAMQEHASIYLFFADIYLPIMSSKSKLSTLLQYRFVKKPLEKISVESRGDEKTSTEESDNSQESQNGTGILTDNDVDIPTISLKYEDSCTSTPTVNGNNLARNIFMILSQGFQYHFIFIR